MTRHRADVDDRHRLDASFLDDLIGKLTLEQKVTLLTGRDFWSTWPIPEIGLRSMVLSDGPSGVRGPVWDERDPSLNLPSASCLSASWDADIARRYGNVAAVEARRKDVDVVLGPTINLHRSPLGGRHFEAFSEDPVLTADLAAAYVTGVQENGVGATLKHYVANDYETERFTASTEVSERALREVYLLAFERAVTEARAWLVMSAYNAVNGVTATEHELLETPLNSEWGFDGVVVSDWTAVRSLESAKAAQDLVMPGPDGPWGDALTAAVIGGHIDEATVDRKVRRILLLAARVGALGGIPAVSPEPTVVEDGVAFARLAAVEGAVLLRNDGILPLDAETLSTVAVIGHNAVQARTQGGGSATVIPAEVVSPLDGLRQALPDAEVTHARGAVVQQGIAELPLEQIRNPHTGEQGMRVRFLDADGAELFAEDRYATGLVYFGGDAPITSAHTVELATEWTPATTGEVLFGFASVGHGRIFVDGELRADETSVAVGDDLGAAILAPPSVSTPIGIAAGEPVSIRVVFDLTSRAEELAGAFAITVGLEPDTADPQGLLDEAVRVATQADVAVVVVGTDSRVESEGFDRTDLALPGRQDDLVRTVASTGTPTIVVVNAGAPVLMPWRDQVAAVLIGWFGGQQMGEALADILMGVAEPGGRLPTTWPARQEDVPVLDVTPVDGVLAYKEGIHVGYRAWLRKDIEPAYWFGWGLGYTSWELGDLDVVRRAGVEQDALIRVSVRNTGDRPGKQVVHVYLARSESDVDRPMRWLAAHAVVRADPGARHELEIAIPSRAFAHWDTGWQWEPGQFDVLVGTSAVDLPLTSSIECTSPGD